MSALNIRTILVPVDFTDAAADAARYAAALGVRFNACVTLLHVVPPVTFEFALAEPTATRYAELADHRNQVVRQAFEPFPPGPALPGDVRRMLAEGDPTAEIVRTAHEAKHDLIVMPSRGRSALQRWLTIGSVTTKVLHDAECPVLAGIDFARPISPFAIDHIVCAIDLGPRSAPVLAWGAAMARELGAGLTIVHAIPTHGEAVEELFDQSWRMTLESRVRARIDALLAETGAIGDVILTVGDPHKVVADAARRVGADLVVIGRGVSDDLLGRLRAHAYAIIRQSPCPVVSL